MKDLIKVAEELSKVMNFEEGGPPVEGTEKELGVWVKEAVDEIDYEEDKFSDEAIQYLTELKLWKGDAAEGQEEPTAEVIEEGTDNLVDQIKAAGQMRELKIICKDLDEFKSIRGQLTKYKTAKDLREVMLGMLEGEEEPEVAAESKPKVEKEKKPVKKSTPVVKKEVKEKSGSNKTEFGHLQATQSGEIDEQFIGKANKKIALSTIVDNTGFTPARIKSHIAHLIKNKGIKIAITTVDKDLVYKYTK